MRVIERIIAVVTDDMTKLGIFDWSLGHLTVEIGTDDWIKLEEEQNLFRMSDAPRPHTEVIYHAIQGPIRVHLSPLLKSGCFLIQYFRQIVGLGIG